MIYSGVYLVVLGAFRDPATSIAEACARTTLEKETFEDAFSLLVTRGLIQGIEGSKIYLTEAGEAVLKGVSN